MMRHTPFLLVFSVLIHAMPAVASAEQDPIWILELEAGPVWQSSNDVQIPNTEDGTRFSLEELVGKGPWPAGRLYLTWNATAKSSFRLLLAPLSYTESGTFGEEVRFAGATYAPGVRTEATYQFNSWRLSYRYRIKDGERWRLWIGGTAKVRDAKIELRQGDTTSRDTDVGFVPLFNFAAHYRLGERWRLLFDIDALAGGPGRAIDLSLKLGYDINDRWGVTAGYRTVEGGADTDDVYNFAWFNSAVVSAVCRF